MSTDNPEATFTQADVDDAVAVAMRSQLARQLGLSDTDRDLLLTGRDEATLLAQAARLGTTERWSSANVAPREGNVRQTGKKPDPEVMEFIDLLFGNDF